MKQRLLGLDLDALTLAQARSRCEEAITRHEALMIGVVNAAKIVKTQRDLALHEAVSSCDLILADGMSVVWASRILGAPLPERVAGIDLFMELLASADRHAWSVYFFGATQEVLDEVLRRVREDFPGLRIAGSHHGYVDEAEELRIVDEMKTLGPDMLFLGMGTPKKEYFIHRHGRATGCTVCHGVGGSFDVLAGKVQRAPERWQAWGMEWLYRVLQEPGRLWWRYLSTNVAFMWLVLRERVRGGGGSSRRMDPNAR
jgi:N-acetylglucosaminyldiphosphoundecaprenol N-acetyl-beta-D-mannosaminyltransferase